MKIEKSVKEVNKENHKWWHEFWPLFATMTVNKLEIFSSGILDTKDIEVRTLECECGYEHKETTKRTSEL